MGYGGIHVVSNAATLMVRYVFLIPSSVTTVPVAANVAPAMLSVYNSLRAGALLLYNHDEPEGYTRVADKRLMQMQVGIERINKWPKVQDVDLEVEKRGIRDLQS